MTGWYRQVAPALSRISTWREYARAQWWSVIGADIAARVAIGTNCVVDRPWGVSIGERSRLESAVWVKLVDDDARVRIGKYSFIGAYTELDVIQYLEIGDHTVIAPRCFITDHDHGMHAGYRIDQQPCNIGMVRIGSDCWIGTGVSILRGVQIGDGAVVGAGAVVRENVAPMTIVAGVPSRPIGRRQ